MSALPSVPMSPAESHLLAVCGGYLLAQGVAWLQRWRQRRLERRMDAAFEAMTSTGGPLPPPLALEPGAVEVRRVAEPEALELLAQGWRPVQVEPHHADGHRWTVVLLGAPILSSPAPEADGA